ncbi:MAG: DUF4239 domain-containing protein [Candidatus Eremiobacteraeota bacterium]|nr:DUF4239 domain-containing protein [Candidatus Eremiobacteraeota bacterium]
MISWLESLPTVTAGIVIVGGFVLIALAIGYLVARFTSVEVRTAHNDRAGFILAVIGVIYAVLLAFVAIGVWERFQEAEARTYDEAGALATVYRDAGSYAAASRLRARLRSYVLSVIDDEWPRMSRGAKPRLASPSLEAVDRNIRALPVDSPRLADIQTQMLSAIDRALMDHETRLTVDSSGISRMMWVVLIVGAVVTVAFTYLFGFDRTLMQELMIGGLSFLIGLVLFLIIALDYPFRGGISVSPEAFRALLDTFTAIGR